jgi:hypothetical protein
MRANMATVVPAYADDRIRSRGGFVLVLTGTTVGPQVDMRSIGISVLAPTLGRQ